MMERKTFIRAATGILLSVGAVSALFIEHVVFKLIGLAAKAI